MFWNLRINSDKAPNSSRRLILPPSTLSHWAIYLEWTGREGVGMHGWSHLRRLAVRAGRAPWLLALIAFNRKLQCPLLMILPQLSFSSVIKGIRQDSFPFYCIPLYGISYCILSLSFIASMSSPRQCLVWICSPVFLKLIMSNITLHQVRPSKYPLNTMIFS